MSDSKRFPYGNDLRKPAEWVGNPDTKSKKYLAAYAGGNALSYIYDAHTVIFFGIESLSVGVFDLESLGFQAGVGPSKVAKFGKRVSEILDRAADGIGRAKKFQEDAQIDDIDDPAVLYRLLAENASFIEADEAFSMNDLAGAWGTIYGGEVEVYGAAALYYISAGYSFRDSDEYISYEQVFNLGTGTLGIGGGMAGGKWVPRKMLSAYWRHNGSLDADDQPFMQYSSALPYLRMLPPPEFEVPEHVVRIGEEYASQQL